MNSLTHSREAVGQPARDVPNLIKINSSTYFLNIQLYTWRAKHLVWRAQKRNELWMAVFAKRFALNAWT
jgi:hypothetical protein